MKLTVQHNIPDSPYKDIIISFASLFVKQKYSELQNIIAEDVYIVLFNRERKSGIDTVLDYFKEWQERVGDTFECEVRWSAQFSLPEVYFTSEKYKQAYILGIENSKIVRILLIPRSFSAVGFSIDEVPYNVGFIDANVPKEIEPLPNHNFCPICGKDSEQLEWRTGVIFKDGPGWGKKTGLMVNASICPDCQTVCEVSPDRKEKFCLTMTREQQEKADAAMSEEELAKYVDNTNGNKRPLFKSVLKSRTNELSLFGQSFHDLLDRVVENGNTESVLSFLDKLSLDRELKLHVDI